jgi:hypothetical protein
MTFQLPRGGKGGDANTVPEVNVPAVIGGGAGDGGNGAKIGLAATNDLYVYNSGGGGGGPDGAGGRTEHNDIAGNPAGLQGCVSLLSSAATLYRDHPFSHRAASSWIWARQCRATFLGLCQPRVSSCQPSLKPPDEVEALSCTGQPPSQDFYEILSRSFPSM